MSAALALDRDPDSHDSHTTSASDNVTHSSSAVGPIPLRFHPDGPAAAHLRRQHLQEQAFTLACKGCRSPEIARRLGVSERTIRAWLRQMRAELAADPAFDRAGQLLLAVEGLREILQAAWHAFEEDRAAQEALLEGQLDYLRKRVVREDPAHRSGAPQVVTDDYARPRFTSHAPTHLRLALTTQVAIARLLGLYDPTLPAQPQGAVAPQAEIPAETATPPTPAALSARQSVTPAETAIPPAHSVGASTGRPQTAMPKPAETAIPLDLPETSPSSAVQSAIPAETATPRRSRGSAPNTRSNKRRRHPPKTSHARPSRPAIAPARAPAAHAIRQRRLDRVGARRASPGVTLIPRPPSAVPPYLTAPSPRRERGRG